MNYRIFLHSGMVWYAGQMLAQIAVPASPQFPASQPLKVQPVSMPFFWNSTVSSTPDPMNAIPMGATSAEVLLIVQQQARSFMNVNSPVLPASGPQSPSALLQAANVNKKQDLKEVLNEIHLEELKAVPPINLNGYLLARQKIQEMLEGKASLCLADAYYYTEAAYGQPYLSYEEYKNDLQQSANFIKKWLKQQQLPLVPLNIHYAVQQFMGDTLHLRLMRADAKKQPEVLTHFPFQYDYEDYEGEVDYRNYFSTKCVATGTGQCNSLPVVYLGLCEALGADAYLSFAPFHSFIKYKNAQGLVVNYEPTSHWTLSDKWYQDYLAISPQARKTGIYLDTLNKKQIVAHCLVDLAVSYLHQTKMPDTGFVNQCLAAAHPVVPNSPYVYLAKSALLYRQLYQALIKHGTNDLAQIDQFPDTRSLHERLLQNEAYLRSLGYQDLPQQVYNSLLEQQNNKTRDPKAKTPKSLFQYTQK